MATAVHNEIMEEFSILDIQVKQDSILERCECIGCVLSRYCIPARFMSPIRKNQAFKRALAIILTSTIN